MNEEKIVYAHVRKTKNRMYKATMVKDSVPVMQAVKKRETVPFYFYGQEQVPYATIAMSEDGRRIGAAICSKNDQYDRRVGRALAEQRMGTWTEFIRFVQSTLVGRKNAADRKRVFEQALRMSQRAVEHEMSRESKKNDSGQIDKLMDPIEQLVAGGQGSMGPLSAPGFRVH